MMPCGIVCGVIFLISSNNRAKTLGTLQKARDRLRADYDNADMFLSGFTFNLHLLSSCSTLHSQHAVGCFDFDLSLF